MTYGWNAENVLFCNLWSIPMSNASIQCPCNSLMGCGRRQGEWFDCQHTQRIDSCTGCPLCILIDRLDDYVQRIQLEPPCFHL